MGRLKNNKYINTRITAGSDLGFLFKEIEKNLNNNQKI